MAKQTRPSELTKVTISLPRSLVSFADDQAAHLGTSRSGVIAAILKAARDQSQDELAREGYRFYAQESREFAESVSQAAAEAMEDVGPAW